jgi:hypothetical protein
MTIIYRKGVNNPVADTLSRAFAVTRSKSRAQLSSDLGEWLMNELTSEMKWKRYQALNLNTVKKRWMLILMISNRTKMNWIRMSAKLHVTLLNY